ncbi:MAG: PTS sugar transporter subunit IIA [Akkermansiaceae bacterium]|nr:PTS sugar transporter subunit IIA [Akkermansiaceae bacterium]
MAESADQALFLKVRPTLLPVVDREGALRLLAREAAESMGGGEAEAERIFRDAWERECIEPTYLGMGLAVPHARMDENLPRAMVYVGFSQAGIAWPQEEAHHIALLIVPWDNPEMHLHLLSRLVRWRCELTEAEACALAESHEKLSVSLDNVFLDML